MIYISYKIKALENLKISSSGNQVDNEYSIGYIPGSTIRGAFIKNYIQKFNIKDIERDEQASSLFFKGKMKFINAYPIREAQRTLPFPLCFYSSKDVIREFTYGISVNKISANKSISKYIVNELDEDVREDYKKIKLGEFSVNDFSGDLTAVNVSKVQTLHIAKKKEDKDKNYLFRYETIKAGEEFKAYISFDGDKKEVEKYLDLINERIVYLGGSKGSGYGKCKIYDVKILENNPEITDIDYDDVDFYDEFYLYAISDIISTDEYGQVIGYINPKILKEKLNLENVKLEKSSIETCVVAGYNNKWGTRLAQYKCIKAGSVFKYSFKGEIDIELLKELMNEGIGLRKEEGYGRFIILDDFSVGRFWAEDYKDRKEIKLEKLSSKEKNNLEQIFKNIYSVQVEKSIDNYIYKITNSMNSKSANENQIGKLLQNVINISNVEPNKGKEFFKSYMYHLSYDRDGKERSNKRALNQLEDVKINNMKLTDYINEIIENSDNVEYFISNIAKNKPLKIGEVEFKPDRNYAYNYTLKMLEKLLRFMLRTKKEA